MNFMNEEDSIPGQITIENLKILLFSRLQLQSPKVHLVVDICGWCLVSFPW